jgi:hypothetical protein
MTDQEPIKKLLEPLFNLFRKNFLPASEELLAEFQRQTSKRNIPETVVEQLADFYKLTNGVPHIDRFTFHRCNDKNLFAWWSEHEELLLGYRDSDILRWKNNRFCIGNANRVSYSDECEFSTLSELFDKSLDKWYLGKWKKFMESNNDLDLWHEKLKN